MKMSSIHVEYLIFDMDTVHYLKNERNISMVFVQYGRKVKCGDNIMTVSIVGKGNKTIVLLPGLGSPSPVIEFKALSSFLCDQFRVITVEYLGYGMSDKPSTERSLDNITEELHMCLRELNCEQYILAAHSISGIYCLYYANKYPDEVECFIGIDNSVPYQIDSDTLMKENLEMLEKRRKKSKSKVFKWKIGKSSKLLLSASGRDYKYSNEDMETYSGLMIDSLDAETAIEELKASEKNFGQLKNVHFPVHIPLLFILADRTMKIEPKWFEWHEELLSENTGKIVILHGMHYLHMVQPRLVAYEIKSFLKV